MPPQGEIPNGAGHEQISSVRLPADSSSGVDRDSANSGAVQLHLARVNPGAQLETEPASLALNRSGAANRSRGALEHRHETIARAVHLASFVRGDLTLRTRVVR